MPNRHRGQNSKSAAPQTEPSVAQGAVFPIIGIGASAGGLEACRRFVRALPEVTGMAFILIQHLDPTHESMMADLLGTNTALTVVQAQDGMAVMREHLYVIPPARYLAIANGILHLSPPSARHGARLPIDFFLHSLAEATGRLAVALILSGTGADGSLGLQSIKAHGGLVIAQDPEEAGYDGMPRSAIRTGKVDFVLPLDAVPEALRDYALHVGSMPIDAPSTLERGALHAIIDLLRARTSHDFTLYKQGTLERRIARRVMLAGLKMHDFDGYLEMLHGHPEEVDLLAQDLLINVTNFFRDPKVFEFLATETIPALVAARVPEQPIRVWIAGCSTGEETYSLVMLFREHMDATGQDVKLQFFASDVDPDAIASARDGLYADTITADVSPARLAKFFTREGRGYRVLPELRSAVVFTVQDVLADPPFSRLDLVSCRNLLIYLLPEAQARVFSLFHFALRQGGILLLGNAEAVSDGDERFEVVSKFAHLYRHIGRQRPGEHRFTLSNRESMHSLARPVQASVQSRQAALAELCHRLVFEAHAPAAVLINRRGECVFSLGPTERFLNVAPGLPTHDLLAMALPALRGRLRTAMQRGQQALGRISLPPDLVKRDGHVTCVTVEIQPVAHGGEDLLLICFVETAAPQKAGTVMPSAGKPPPDDGLEEELNAARSELQAAIHDLEISGEEQKAINDEASSLNEELQSTNEELLTSKEELQSLNEELTALNTQLREALERQRTTSNDLQNVLNSTDVATIFLDTELRIRFFTPATRALFNVIPSDIGRPLADLKSLSADGALLTDAQTVLRASQPIEREIEAQGSIWYIRRILPYRTEDVGVEGVVITFVNSTERRRTADALEAAKREAELASIAKSRFLAAASHDLRQPLQSIKLMDGLLTKTIREGRNEDALNLVARLDETATAMSSMLNALLDITQIDGGAIAAEATSFPVGELLERIRNEFVDQADSQGLALRVVGCGQVIHTDRHLLGQMIRNLVSNALKYTRRGRILLGCRRRTGLLSVEVWDTGIGIPAHELDAVFEEYHQIDSGTRERNRGLGLGLSIVQRLGSFLGHRVRVRSELGKGSVFSIEITLPPVERRANPNQERKVGDSGAPDTDRRRGAVLIVEDDPDVRELLVILLKGEGHHVTSAEDGATALALLTKGMIRPDLLLADFNLPNGFNGLQLAAKLRESLHCELPVIILTGDIMPDTLRDIARQNCVHLNKPVNVKDLIHTIQCLLPPLPANAPISPSIGTPESDTRPATVFIIDDDPQICEAMRAVFEENGRLVEVCPTAESFLRVFRPGRWSCMLVDAYLPGMSGLELIAQHHANGHPTPAIMITGNSDVQMVVKAMKAGAVDFIEKPIGREDLIAAVERALEQSRDANARVAWQEDAASHIASLTPRQREIMDMVLAGHPSKNIAADLGISQRTVENHRAEIMRRTGVKSLPALARLAISARRPTGTK